MLFLLGFSAWTLYLYPQTDRILAQENALIEEQNQLKNQLQDAQNSIQEKETEIAELTEKDRPAAEVYQTWKERIEYIQSCLPQ